MPCYSLVFHAHSGDCSVLVTPDQETADLFYRFLQTHPSLNACDHLADIERLSNQMWKVGLTAAAFVDAVRRISRHNLNLEGDCFYTLPRCILAWPALASGLDGALLPVIPHDKSPAPLSGGKFLTRRKTGGQYWYVQHGVIRVGERRTKFRIELVDEVETVGTPILTPSDKVYITALTPLGEHKISYRDGDGTIACGDTHSENRFGALRRRFGVYLSDSYSECVSYLGEDGEGSNSGDEWGLAI